MFTSVVSNFMSFNAVGVIIVAMVGVGVVSGIAAAGTVIALMLPFVAILSVVWTLLLVVWYLYGLPGGF